MADIEALAKLLGITLQVIELDRVRNRIKKKEKQGGIGGKAVSDEDIKAIIKKVAKKPTMLDVAGEKQGGYIKKYAKGSMVRRIRSY